MKDLKYIIKTEKIRKTKWWDGVIVHPQYACGCTRDNWGLFSPLKIKEAERLIALGAEFDLTSIVKWVRNSIYVPHVQVHVILHIPWSCPNCEEIREYKLSNPLDWKLSHAVYSHGVATGYGKSDNLSVYQIDERIKNITSGKIKGEICCSHKKQQVGAVGLFLKGEVTVASNRDLWSKLNTLGERVFNLEKNCQYLITDEEEVNFKIWDHMEFFVIPKEIVGFWVKDWFLKKHPEIQQIFRHLPELEVYVVPSRFQHT